MEVHKPKTIKEAVEDLQQFLECDLYSKFRPEKEINGEVWIRKDQFRNVNDFHKYIEGHFDILLKQIDTLSKADT